jgi:hypothetical protein
MGGRKGMWQKGYVEDVALALVEESHKLFLITLWDEADRTKIPLSVARKAGRAGQRQIET